MNSDITWGKCLLLITVSTVYFVKAIQLTLGGCPIYYDEPCQGDSVRFILSSPIGFRTAFRLVDPFYPVLPRYFNRSVPVKMLIHGYGGLGIDTAIKNVTKAYQHVGYNVIVVDWSYLSSLPCYVSAFLNTWHVGQCIAVLAVSLMPQGITPDDLHVVGFSLGAHVAGFASNHLQKVVGLPFGRITGLDPALPFFANLKNDWKLDSSDASFVDVIHTGAGSFGKIEASGHVDFYVNGGFLQPACLNFTHPPICSHIMSGVYFAESVTSKDFVGIQCDNIALYYLGYCRFPKINLAVMGEHADRSVRGIYSVETASEPPYALGQVYVRYVNKIKQYYFIDL